MSANSLPGATFPRQVVRVYLYKLNANTKVWKLFHQDFTFGKYANWAGQGADPSDLDVSSSDVASALGGAGALQRMPFDSWFPRKVGLSTDVLTGLPGADPAKNSLVRKAQNYYALEDLDATKCRLNWKNIYSADFKKDFKEFLDVKRNNLAAALQDLFTLFSTDRNSAISRYDLTGFVLNYRHTTTVEDSTNGVSMTLVSDPMAFLSGANGEIASSSSYGDTRDTLPYISDSSPVSGNKQNSIPVVDENDIVEIRVKYLSPDNDKWGITEGGFTDSDGFHRVFMGFITRQSKTMSYPSTEKLELTIDGPAKMLQIFDTAFVPSAMQVTGEMFAPYTEMSDLKFTLWGNNFTAQTADTIFERMMGNVLFAEKYGGNYSDIFSPTALSDSTGSGITPPPDVDVDYYVFRSDLSAVNTSFQFIAYLPVLMGMARQYAAYDAQVRANGDTLVYSKPADTRSTVLNEVLGCVEQSSYIAYKAMLQTSFRLFYPELKRPGQILSDIRETTQLECFDDRPGVIRLRPPKYNIINLNPEITEYAGNTTAPLITIPTVNSSGITQDITLSAEYVISPADISAVGINKDDYSLITRADHTWELPVAGGLDISELTGHFTNAGEIMRYGLRTSGPQHNPMSLSPAVATALSAVYLARANKDVRTMSCRVFNNREYRVGRLYYIPVSQPDSQTPNTVVSRGLVGYVTAISTDFSQGKLYHDLTMSYIRQAEIVVVLNSGKYVYYANFKRLPEVSTYMRLLASNGDFYKTAVDAVHNPHNGAPEAISGAACGQTDTGLLTIANGTNAPTLQHVPTAHYASTLVGKLGLGTFVNPSSPDLDPEQDIFITPFSAGALKDPGDFGVYMNKHFIAKLLVYDYDPLLKLYPSRRLLYKGISVTSPLTDTLSTRNTTDLLRVIYNQIYWGVITKNGGARMNPDALLYAQSSIKTASGVRYIATSNQVNTPNGNVQLDILVATAAKVDNFNPAFSAESLLSDFVIAFVRTSALTGYKPGVPDYKKFLLFHVPYSSTATPISKSLRLANMINTGVPPGFGYRSISTSSKLNSVTTKTDPFNTGQAVLYTNLDTSLWTLDDVINSCVELDLNDSVPVDADAPPEGSDGNHMLVAFSNAVLEPYNYVQGLNLAYNGTAAIQPGNYTRIQDMITSAWNALPSAAIKAFKGDIAHTPHEVDTSTAESTTANSLKQAFIGGSRQVWVPAYNTFFSSLLAKVYAQPEPRYLSISSQVSESPSPALQGEVYNAFSLSTKKEGIVVAPTGSTLVAGTSWSNDNKFSIIVNSKDIRPVNFQSGDPLTTLVNFCSKNTGDIGLCTFLLRDNISQGSAPVTPIGILDNPVSFIWHGSYSGTPSVAPFQTRDSAQIAKHLLNLPTTNPVNKG